MRTLAFTLAAAFAFMSAPAALAADLAGSWRGAWVKAGEALPVTIVFVRTAGGYDGRFSSDALQVSDIPLSAIVEAGGKVHFEARGDRSTTAFDGMLAGDTLSGRFADRGETGSFRFVRAAAAAAPVRTRDVQFQNGPVTLSGTILAPSAPGRHPAILFLHGSGPEGRWANRYLAEKFAQAGFVALIYDKRGVGRSTGDWAVAGFETLAGDGAAGIRFLRGLPDVDPRRVGIYGHSQGGTIAPLADAQAGGTAFLIASAAGGLPVPDVEAYSVGNSMGIAKLPGEERAAAERYLQALLDVAYRGKDRAVLDGAAAAGKGHGWYFDPPPPDNAYWSLSKQIAGFRPAAAWARVRAPVLLVYGAHDERVPPAASIAAIRGALPKTTRADVKIYPNADHSFTIVDPPSGAWPKHVEDYAQTLIAWTRGALRRGR